MRVLIAPVGEQPTPNLIPLFAEPPERRAECVQFMVSGEVSEVFEHLKRAIGQDETLKGIAVAEQQPMDPWALDRAREECERVITRYLMNGDMVTVNITGGTKIMSLAAYQAACCAQVPMIYVNTKQQRIIDFDVFGKPLQQQRPLIAPISIETQLRAAGRELSKARDKITRGVESISATERQLVKWIVKNHPAAIQECILPVTRFINEALRKKELCDIPFPFPYHAPLKPSRAEAREAAEYLTERSFWKWDGTEVIIAKDQWDWVTGRWLENYAVVVLSEGVTRGLFDQVLGPVFIEGFPEIDAIASQNGQLAILECKLTGRTAEESRADILGKLYSHERLLGGLYGKSIFVRAKDIEKGESDWPAEYGVELIVGAAGLGNLASLVSAKLKG